MLALYRPGDIYHVTVMPCYDKKLEASRSDFYSDIYRTRDVDCVLTSGTCTHVQVHTCYPIPVMFMLLNDTNSCTMCTQVKL